MSDKISFDGVELDAEVVRAKLAEFDAPSCTVGPFSMVTSIGEEGLTFQMNVGQAWLNGTSTCRCWHMAKFEIRKFADFIYRHLDR